MPQFLRIPNEEYHAGNEQSSTKVKAAELGSGKHYYEAQYGPKKEPTQALIEGSAFHAMMEDQAIFDAEFIVKPEGLSLSTKEGKKWKAENVLHRQILLPTFGEKLKRMSEAVFNFSPALEFMDIQGESETSHYWTDEMTGLRCKCRPDYITDNLEYVIDYKTTTDASKKGFQRAIVQYGYDIQAGFYMEGIEKSMGHRPKNFIFIVVEKQPPFNVAVYVADDEMVTLGYEKARRGLSKIKYWEDAKEFPNYSETVEIIGLPDWAKGKKNSTNLSPMDIELY